ncbi:glycosyltransferase [Humidesulfovibrio mexicanus]|nr:glycosyltransferase [Humidesulfovibrio mexicanus]
MKIVHVCGRAVADPALRLHGSVKDIQGRSEYFAERGVGVRQVLVDDPARAFETMEATRAWPAAGESAILFESSFCPRALEHVRRSYPHVRVLLRPHNAELPHRLDWARACGPGLAALGWARHAVVNVLRDWRSARAAHRVLPISDWEAYGYWSRLTRPDKVIAAPFFLPKQLREVLPEVPDKERLCVNLGAARGNPLVFHALGAFSRCIEGLGGDAPGWCFASSGDAEGYAGPVSPRVERFGVLESPYPLLARARAMALLSPLGGGFKTKVLEAVACRTWVIVPAPLARKLPLELRPCCIVLDEISPAGFAAALKRALEPFPEDDPGVRLRSRAFSALDAAFWL